MVFREGAFWGHGLGFGGQRNIPAYDDCFRALVDDHQLSLHMCSSQLRGTTGEQPPVLDWRVREANDERGQVRGAFFDPVARNRQQRFVRHVG